MKNTDLGRRKLLKFIAGSPALFFLQPSLAFSSEFLGASDQSDFRIPSRVSNADEAALLVLRLAEEANRQGTFGVGGAIIENATGRVLKAMHNRVMQRLNSDLGALSNKIYTHDPSAHGERQLVSWYYANAKKEKLPEPSDLTVVTSLDPCAMCAGSLTTAGFNVAVVAYDTYAGINYNEQFNFPSMPDSIGQRLKHQFGYYAVVNGRRYAGASNVLFRDGSIDERNLLGCSRAFEKNVDTVRDASSSSGLDPRDPKSGMSDPLNSPLKDAYQKAFLAAFSIRLADYRRPDISLKAYLEQIVKNTPGAKNAVAFIDYYGNLLMAAPDRFDVSPIATAFMNTVQEYSKLRFQMVNDPTTSAVAQKTLSNPKYGTFVFLNAPDGFDTRTLKDMGVYGSTMEGAIPVTSPSNFQYFNDPMIGSIGDLRNLIAAMPPLYTELVGINPQKVVL